MMPLPAFGLFRTLHEGRLFTCCGKSRSHVYTCDKQKRIRKERDSKGEHHTHRVFTLGLKMIFKALVAKQQAFFLEDDIDLSGGQQGTSLKHQ